MVVHRLANELAKHPDDRVTVFSLSPKPSDARYEHMHLFPDHLWLDENRLARLVVLPLLLNRVDFSAYDVLHMHGEDWFLLHRPLPTVRTLHGSALHEACTATSLKRRLGQYLVYPLEHLAQRLATEVQAVGPETQRHYGTDHLANNGVNLEMFKPGPKTPTPSVLFVGSWEGRKRGRFLFEAFTQHVLPQVPDATLHMVCPTAVQHENVIFHDRPSDAELAHLYREAWVFAYPSIYEGFGLPYLEALASGTAVLCSPNQGAAYVLKDGTYGLIVDDESFAPSLVRLLTDDAERSTWADRGRQRAETFAWPEVAAQHRALYRQAIARWRTRG